VTEEASSVKSQKQGNNQDKHSGETETKEADEAAEDQAKMISLNGTDTAEESEPAKSAMSPKEEGYDQDEHSRKVGAKESAEAAEAAKDEASEKDVGDDSDFVESAKSPEEGYKQDEHSRETEAKEAAQEADAAEDPKPSAAKDTAV
jgi:hypothetical protein